MNEWIIAVPKDGMLINSTPVQELVRCKDCKWGGIDPTSYPHEPDFWCPAHSEYHDADFFCADGERR